MSDAQTVGGSNFIQGRFLEQGVAANGSFGPTGAPAGYHPYPAGSGLAMVYDYGHDGWTTGTPPYYGDYTYPGTPFEGWSIQVNGTRRDAFYTTGGGVGTSFTAGLTGSNTAYSNVGGIVRGTWTGTCGGLNLTQETRIDAAASWGVTTVTFTNPTAAAITGVYYWRTCDPDNDETRGGSFTTTNTIVWQNPATDNRVQVSATGNTHTNDYISLCTKDCRAKSMIYVDWSSFPALTAGNSLDKIYNQTSTGLGATYYTQGNQTVAQDIAIGLIYNIGTIAAGASTTISYAYTFGTGLTTGLANATSAANAVLFNNSIDSAFPEPLLVVNGVPGPPSGPAPAPTYDTFRSCGTGLTSIPVNLNFASDKVWTGSTWTWSPATGLASTTGVTNTITTTALPPSITYTITGTNAASCNSRVMYLTVTACNGATVNSPCVGDPLTFNAPGDSTAATYSWYGPAPATTVVATTQAFTMTPSVWADTGTYHVVKTVAGVSDTALTIVILQPIPTLTGPTSLCPGGTETLTATPPGGTWSSSNPAVASIGASTGLVTAGSLGTTTMTYMSPAGCVSTTPVTVAAVSVISGNMTLCMNTTTTLADAAPSGTWASGNTPVATVELNTGIVHGVTAGTAVITYTINGGCYTTATVTVTPVLPITGTAELCQRRATTTLTDGICCGTWSSANPGIATITPVTGIVYGVTAGVATISYVNEYGCISTIAVTVHPTPPVPTAAPQSICQYYTANQWVATGAGPTFTWYGPGVTTGYFPGIVPSTLVPGIDSFYVTQTSSFGCASDSLLTWITVRAKPSTPKTESITYCQFHTPVAPLDSLVSLYTGTLNWYQLSIPLGSTTPTYDASNATYPAGTTWYVSQTVDGCESDSAAVNVDIIYLPDFTIATRGWVCQFDTISLEYSPLGPPLIDGSFLWSIPPNSFFVNGTNQTDASVSVQFDSSTTSNYVYLTASNLNGQCSTTDTLLIDVVELPRANAESKADVCLSDTVSLALSGRTASASDFVWYIDNSPLFNSPAATIIASNSNSGGPFSISWTDTGLHVIHVQAFAEHGCADNPTADTVNVHGLPDASFRVTTLGGALCLEDSVLFSANDSNYMNNYNWAPAHFFTATNNHAEWGRVQSSQSVVTLTITDPFGCIGTTSQELDPGVCCSIPFPNAFSPNGDGINDVFRPIPQRAYHTYHIFRIQNRWGQTIFEATNNKAEWDGTFNGVPQDIGVYFYYLKYDCDGKTLEEKGDCTLVR